MVNNHPDDAIKPQETSLPNAITTHQWTINIPGLLKILGSNIYAEPEIAVREMIANANDACIIRRNVETGFTNPQIYIAYDQNARTLTFSDNGAGMTKDELLYNLSTIGVSLAKLKREELESKGVQDALLLIGQFGIGILSAFSVADRVEIFTRSYQPDSSGYKWVCVGDIDFTIEPCVKPDIGTRVVFHLNNKSLVLLEDEGHRLKRIIKKYADFLSIPILLEKHGQVNSITPPWQQNQQIDYEEYLFARYGLRTIEIIPIDKRHPVDIEGLLFIPLSTSGLAQDFGEVDIYISRVFITERNKELMPPWARFVKGIINSASLKPTVSRDAVNKDETFEQICTILGEFILTHLEKLAQTQEGRKKLEFIVSIYNHVVKTSALHDEMFFRRICPLVHVDTQNGEMTMLQYLANSNDVIYYFSERGSSTQHKLLFAEMNIPVIDASWGIEEEFLEKYAQLFGKEIKRLETETDLLFDRSIEVDERWRDLEMQFKSTLAVCRRGEFGCHNRQTAIDFSEIIASK